MKNVVFSSIIGSFVFSDGNLIDSIEFKDIGQYQRRDEIEQELVKKHHAQKPTEAQLHQILVHFKKREYFERFSSQNLLVTKQGIRGWASKDIIIIQTISAIEELEKVTNLLTKRLREWYSLENPELEYKLAHHEAFLEAMQQENKRDREGMGRELSLEDVRQLRHFGRKILELYSSKNELEKYLEEIELQLCPNLVALAGPTIVAKLISHAGSLKRLAEMPASTLQVLGAEKALFRHLRNKKNLPPKHGLLVQHPLFQKTEGEMHGKLARMLADKLSMAARIDFYKGDYIGNKLKKELEDKFKIQF